MNKRTNQIAANVRSVYPEVDAGGYTRCDGSVDFYSRISALAEPQMRVLDFGAGRGGPFADKRSAFRSRISILKGRVERIVGVDIDQAVLENPFMDETHVIDPDQPLPFEDGSFDLIYSDWVLEHVATPKMFESEVYRLLKPGGWFCARTPNRWGLTGIATNLVPNSLHVRVLAHLQPNREARDVFPTTYLLNSRSRLRRYFEPQRWQDYSYFHSAEPSYFLRSRLMMRLVNFYTSVAPMALGMNMHIFLRKRGPDATVGSA